MSPKPHKEPPFPHKHLLHFVHYEPLTGVFTWLRGTNKGKPAGSVNSKTGVRFIDLPNWDRTERKRYLATHLAVFYMTQKWPQNCVKHRVKGVQTCQYDLLFEAKWAGTRWKPPLHKAKVGAN